MNRGATIAARVAFSAIVASCTFPDYTAPLPEIADTAVADDASGDATDALVCSPTVDLTVHVFAAGPVPLKDASIVSSICGGAATTGANGIATLTVPSGVPVVVGASLDGYASEVTSELIVRNPLPLQLGLVPIGQLATQPGWTQANAKALVLVNTTVPSTDRCGDKSGITLTVADHPEALVAYVTNVNPWTADASLTATTTVGQIEVSGLPAPSFVQLVGTKPGCHVSFAPTPFTGRIPLVAGALTVVNGVLSR